MAQTVKCLPAVRETRVRSLGWEDPLEEMAAHSSTIAWKIPWTEEPGRLQSMGLQRVRHDCATSLSFFMFNSDLFKIDFEFWSKIVLFHMFFGVGVIFIFPWYFDLVPDCQSILGKSWKIE